MLLVLIKLVLFILVVLIIALTPLVPVLIQLLFLIYRFYWFCWPGPGSSLQYLGSASWVAAGEKWSRVMQRGHCGPDARVVGLPEEAPLALSHQPCPLSMSTVQKRGVRPADSPAETHP